MGAATINNRLAAVDAFFALRGSGRPVVVREHLAYYAGLRVADVRLSARKGSVRVRGKGRLGGKDRTVPLHAQARATLEALLDGLGRPAAGPLIRNREGRALSTRSANTVVCALGAAARWPPHRWTWSWWPS